MIKRFYYAITGDPNEKVLKKYRPIVAEIGELEPEFESKSDDQLRGMTITFQQRIQALVNHRPQGLDAVPCGPVELLEVAGLQFLPYIPRRKAGQENPPDRHGIGGGILRQSIEHGRSSEGCHKGLRRRTFPTTTTRSGSA